MTFQKLCTLPIQHARTHSVHLVIRTANSHYCTVLTARYEPFFTRTAQFDFSISYQSYLHIRAEAIIGHGPEQPLVRLRDIVTNMSALCVRRRVLQQLMVSYPLLLRVLSIPITKQPLEKAVKSQFPCSTRTRQLCVYSDSLRTGRPGIE